MSENTGTLDTLIQQKIDGDADFIESIKDFSEDEKANATEAKRFELYKTEAPIYFEESRKNKELADNYKTRAEKAETDLKKNKPPAKEDKNDDGLKPMDVITIMEAKVPSEDVQDVVDYAKFKGISLNDALKSGVVKNILVEKAETRKTAAATQTRQTRTTTKVDGVTIFESIKSKGEDAVPAPGSKEAEEMFWARNGGRKS